MAFSSFCESSIRASIENAPAYKLPGKNASNVERLSAERMAQAEGQSFKAMTGLEIQEPLAA
jgi:hypothetical protein